jgi:hypothetical protein
MASAKKPAAAAAATTTTTPSPLLKTYGERPVPFQFPGNQEKMYIGSEVCLFIYLFKKPFSRISTCNLGWQLFTFISWNTL